MNFVRAGFEPFCANPEGLNRINDFIRDKELSQAPGGDVETKRLKTGAEKLYRATEPWARRVFRPTASSP
jgi:hypothetical protein